MLKRIKYKKMSNKSGRNFCDELWTLTVKTRDNHCCAICNVDVMPNAHHLISRKVFKYRWDIDNGLTLCPNHHEFSNICSAHTAPWGIEEWLKENRPEQYANHVKQRNNIENVKTNYQEIYYQLEQQYKELTGEYHMISRLSQYIMFKNAADINAFHVHQGKSYNEIAEVYGVSSNMMKKFMKDNKIS